MDNREFREKLKQSNRVVIKIGSAVISENNNIDIDTLSNIVDNVAYILQNLNKQVIMVSSGAVSSGMSVMGIKKRPENIVHQQALAAIGQPELINAYKKNLKKHNITASQVLITVDDIQNRRRFINAKNSIETLIKWKILPIINENDTVVIKELRFGDNDNLASYIVNLVEADFLIMLTNVDGVYDKSPESEKSSVIEFMNKDYKIDYFKNKNNLGSGGMKSKVDAGLKIAQLGKIAVIINGKKRNALKRLFEDKNFKKTVFEPSESPITSKKSWINNCSPNGVVVIDDGAAESIKNNKSLLASGIDKVYGVFGRGDIVNIESKENILVAKGMVNYDSSEIEKIKGSHSSKIVEILGYKYSNDVIHIDNMVIVQ